MNINQAQAALDYASRIYVHPKLSYSLEDDLDNIYLNVYDEGKHIDQILLEYKKQIKEVVGKYYIAFIHGDSIPNKLSLEDYRNYNY